MGRQWVGDVMPSLAMLNAKWQANVFTDLHAFYFPLWVRQPWLSLLEFRRWGGEFLVSHLYLHASCY